MGMNFFFVVCDYISGIISMGWDGCVICSRCVNLFEYVEKWCLNLKYLEVKFIDKQCQEIYEYYGFFLVWFKVELRDFIIFFWFFCSEMEVFQ